MIKKIAIVPYVTNGRNSQVGHDGHFNILKKKRSTVLKENLQSVIKTKNWKTEVIVDVNHGDLQSLKREGVNLFLIPEDIARYIDYSLSLIHIFGQECKTPSFMVWQGS